MRRLALPALALLAAAGCCLLPWHPASGSAFDFPAEDSAGRPVDLSGPGQVRVVDVWATWCEPCREAAPRVHAVLARHPEVEGVMLSIDDSAELAERYAERAGLTLRQLHFVGGSYGAQRAGITAIPLVVVVDAQGRVVDSLSRVTEEALEQALAEAKAAR